MDCKFEDIKKIIERYLEFESTVEINSDLRNDLGIDSMTINFLVQDLEKEYNISIKQESVNIDNFSTPKTIVTFINTF